MSTTLSSGTSQPRVARSEHFKSQASSSSSQEQSQQFLTFYLPSQQRAMVPTDSLIEVLTLSPNQIIPIPDTPTEAMGVCNWRGEVLWLIDAGYLLSQIASFVEADYQTKFSVVVLQRQGRSLGLVVDRVSDMVWCLQTEIRAVVQETAADRGLMGTWQSAHEDHAFSVLDPDLILNLFV
jgi:positive phototaxis protein PixI